MIWRSRNWFLASQLHSKAVSMETWKLPVPQPDEGDVGNRAKWMDVIGRASVCSAPRRLSVTLTTTCLTLFQGLRLNMNTLIWSGVSMSRYTSLQQHNDNNPPDCDYCCSAGKQRCYTLFTHSADWSVGSDITDLHHWGTRSAGFIKSLYSWSEHSLKLPVLVLLFWNAVMWPECSTRSPLTTPASLTCSSYVTSTHFTPAAHDWPSLFNTNWRHRVCTHVDVRLAVGRRDVPHQHRLIALHGNPEVHDLRLHPGRTCPAHLDW